jgi:hypothetical protein
MVYRMTLGSLWYDHEIKKDEAKESETEIGKQTIVFLTTKYPYTIAKMDNYQR